MYHSCQTASKSVQLFSKYCVHKFGNRQTNGPTDRLRTLVAFTNSISSMYPVIMPPPLITLLLIALLLSVRLSVTYIAHNSQTQRPSVPKFGRKVPHLRCDSHTVSRSNGQRSRSPGPLMLTHIVRHIFGMARPTNFKLGIRMEDDDRISHRHPFYF